MKENKYCQDFEYSQENRMHEKDCHTGLMDIMKIVQKSMLFDDENIALQ